MQNSIAVGTAERALSFQVYVSPGKCYGHCCDFEHVPYWYQHSFLLIECPSLSRTNFALLINVSLSCANAWCLSGCLYCQQLAFLVFSCSSCQLIKITFKQKPILLVESVWADVELILDLFKELLLVRWYKCSSCAVVYQNALVDRLGVHNL